MYKLSKVVLLLCALSVVMANTTVDSTENTDGPKYNQAVEEMTSLYQQYFDKLKQEVESKQELPKDEIIRKVLTAFDIGASDTYNFAGDKADTAVDVDQVKEILSNLNSFAADELPGMDTAVFAKSRDDGDILGDVKDKKGFDFNPLRSDDFDEL